MILSVKLFKASHIDLVLELGDAEILDLDGISDGPLETNRYRRQVVGVLDKLELGTTVKSLTLELDAEWLTVHDLEEDAQVVLANLFRIVEHMQVHLLTRCKRASPWLDLEDLLVKDLLLKGLLFTWCTRVSPGFHLDFRVVGHLEVPVSLHATDILQGERDSAWL